MKQITTLFLMSFQIASAHVLMQHMPAEVNFGIGGFESFNCGWQPLFERIKLPELYQSYEIDDIPHARFAHQDLRNCHRTGVVNVHDYPKRKKILVVHEMFNYSLDAIRDADYLIFMNDYQRQIAENIAGINKPCLVLACHPIPFHLTKDLLKRNLPRNKSVYIGGHFFSCKHDGLIDRLERLLTKLDADPQTRGATISCYFLVAFDYLVEPFNNFIKEVSQHDALKDRVACIERAENIDYMTMFENMARCSHTYLWRNEGTLDELKEYVARNDPAILGVPVGESSMLANAIAAGCIPIAEPNYRFRACFETDLTYSYKDFVEQLADFIIEIDKESRKNAQSIIQRIL